jgi:hypothetical protein
MMNGFGITGQRDGKYTDSENAPTCGTLGLGEKETESTGIDEDRERLSIDKCRATLGGQAEALSNDEVLCLRDFLYRLADIICADIEQSYRDSKEDKTCDAA